MGEYYTLPSFPYIDKLVEHISPIYMIDRTSICVVNNTLELYLNQAKEAIEPIQNKWDKFKRYTNPYEFIHTFIPGINQSVAKFNPLSRSFFKMHELLKTFNLPEYLPNDSIKSYHIAEGPGGFIEALVYARNNINDKYYGITLINKENTAVPGWTKSKTFLKEHSNVIIETGIDGTGDITNPDNLKDCFNKHKGTADIITADGGFDFSLTYNQQETISHKLVFAEIAFAFAAQKKGGCFILKMFDIFTEPSIDILYLLCSYYDNVSIIKPFTSRYANSERYIVCRGFRLDNTESLIQRCSTILSEYSAENNIKRVLSLEIPYAFKTAISEINAILGQQQLEYIQTTLAIINNSKYEKLQILKRTNIQRCITWCQKFKIPYNRINTNTNIFSSSKDET
jgi:hypothetical protein